MTNVLEATSPSVGIASRIGVEFLAAWKVGGYSLTYQNRAVDTFLLLCFASKADLLVNFWFE